MSPAPEQKFKRSDRGDRKRGDRYSEKAHERTIEIFFLLFVLMAVMGSLGGLLNNTIQRIASQFSPINSLEDVRTSIGSDISLRGDSDVFSSPGGDLLGVQPKGSKGRIVEGPEYFDGERYWYIDFLDGSDGWVGERNLLNGNGGPFNPSSTPVGRGVFAVRGDIDIRESPGGQRVGSQPFNAYGVLTQGPLYANSERYWYVDFESGPDGWVAESDIVLEHRQGVIERIIGWIGALFKILSTVLSLLFLSGIIYAVLRTSQISAEQHKKQKLEEHPAHAAAAGEEHRNRRWERVLAHVQNESPADWRLAILEADIMLAALLEKMGYIGENVGEKLKRIEQSDFNSIDDAWEAHKVRNLIAHQGSDYVLSKREAQRVIGLYANVFREFRYI